MGNINNGPVDDRRYLPGLSRCEPHRGVAARLVNTELPKTLVTYASEDHDVLPRSAIPLGPDAVCGDFAVSFDIRYVYDAEGDRVAAAQAKAISALLSWLSTRADTTADHIDQPEHRPS